MPEKNKSISALTTEIVKRFNEKKQDVWATAEALKLDRKRVLYHLRKAGVELPKGSYSSRASGKAMSAPLSQLHSAVGAKIGYLRMEKGMGESSEFAQAIGMSTKRYGSIERGQADATLSDMQRIAKGFSLGVSELLTPLSLK